MVTVISAVTGTGLDFFSVYIYRTGAACTVQIVAIGRNRTDTLEYAFIVSGLAGWLMGDRETEVRSATLVLRGWINSQVAELEKSFDDQPVEKETEMVKLESTPKGCGCSLIFRCPFTKVISYPQQSFIARKENALNAKTVTQRPTTTVRIQ